MNVGNEAINFTNIYGRKGLIKVITNELKQRKNYIKINFNW